MEYRNLVYNAARDGKLSRLRLFLDYKSKDEVSKLVNATTNGATPLIMAGRNGHVDVVKFLIDVCKAELDNVGSVTFDGETIEGAPPLWCAAAAGHSAIVKLLVERGSDVNQTTLTNSTPLRAACFDGHFDIVKYLVEHKANIEIANRHGHTCLMISCYKGHQEIAHYLLNQGADVNRKSIKGNTSLHDCAESGSLEIMKMLLRHNATMEKDSYNMTPLLAASVAGYTKIVKFLMTRPESMTLESIDALELLGATYVDKKRDMTGALQLWRQAMDIRYADNKHPMLKKVREETNSAYEHVVEVTRPEHLTDILSEPDDMRMQSLLVRERILGPSHPDTSYYIRYRGALYADMGNFDRCITLWMYALDMQQRVLDPLSPMTQSSFLSFAELFSFMMTEFRSRPPHPVAFSDILAVLRRAVNELEEGRKHLSTATVTDKDKSHQNRLSIIIMHMLCLMCRLQTSLSDEQDHEFKKCAYNLVHNDMILCRSVDSKCCYPLHLACSKETTSVGRYPVCTFPSMEVAQVLIDVGADVHTTDLQGNTPLHVAASNRPCKPEIIKLLLNEGAHLDACNKDHKTPMQLLHGMSIYDIVPPMSFINLQCLAARKVVKCGIPYKNHIPTKLAAFVDIH